MRLSALLEAAGLEAAGLEASGLEASGLEARGPWEDAAVSGFAIDHRKVAPGTVFGAFKGARFNAEQFIPQAIEAGAIAVVASPEARIEGAAHVASDQPRRAFAQLAARFFEPVPEAVVAVTGTNGKTSTVEMTRQIWRMCGLSAASIGTLGVTTPDGSVSTGLTTPDIVTFLANMAGLAREGVTHVAYEASSHGLAQYRSEGPTLAAAAFTNFSRDHLDYHGTMDAYFEAKMRLFTDIAQPGSPAVIFDGGRDPVWIPQAIERASARGLDVRTVGERGKFLRLTAREATQLGQVLTVEFEGSARTVNLPLIGQYQAANALVAAGLALSTGCGAGQVFDALGRLQPVRGRLERAAITPAGAPVYVDYAHTPDALEAAIEALHGHVDDARGGRLAVVFGAGGDRDPGKRAPMGAVAARTAGRVIVTDDNPRGEDPAAIRAAILDGARGAGGAAEIVEVAGRRDAIAQAIGGAGEHDIVLVAGKGHEQGQIMGAGADMRILPFDDVEAVRECAAATGQDPGR